MCQPLWSHPDPNCGVCLHVYMLRPSLCISQCQELNRLLPVSELSGCVVVVVGVHVADPLLSLQVSHLEACDCRHWCHCGSVLPPAYLCLFSGLSGSRLTV